MKLHFYFLSVLFSAVFSLYTINGWAQEDLPFTENFESYTNTDNFLSTSGWTIIDADGDGYNWFLIPGTQSNVLASESWDDAPLTPENFLITPQINLPADISGGSLLLGYDIAATGNNFYEEHYKVVVSTTGTGVGDFPDVNIVFEETLTQDESGSNFARRHIDIGQFAGQDVYIAFVHYDVTDQDMLLLNNVMVRFVNSATIYPELSFYNPNNPEDVVVNIDWYGATEVSTINDGTANLQPETDYVITTVDPNTSALTIKSEYLAGTPQGDLELIVAFDNGDPFTITIRVAATIEDAEFEPAFADFYPSSPDDVVLNISWGSATQVTSLMAGEETVDPGLYSVEANQLIVNSSFFQELEPGYVVFNASFDQGNDALFVVRIFDDQVQVLPFEEHFMGMDELVLDTPEGWLPNGWTARDADQDGFNWFWAPVVIDDTLRYGRMTSQSAYQNDQGDYVALTPDNWLITPPIQLNSITGEGQEINLYFEVAPGASTPAFKQEHYSIMISYTDDDPASFESIYSETLSTEHEGYQLREVELSFYEGQIVYLAFRHHDVTDMDRLLLTKVEVRMLGGTGINNPQTGTLSLFPNPANDRVTIESETTITSIMVIDMLGKIIIEEEVGELRHSINTSNLPQGTYVLRTITQGGTFTDRLQVVK